MSEGDAELRAQLAHDARAELANLAGYLELTIQRGGASLSEPLQRYLAQALASVGRLCTVLDRITADA